MKNSVYEKYSKKYYEKAKLGVTLKTYLLSIRNFSVYFKLMEKGLPVCPEVNTFFSKRQVSDWGAFKDISRTYAFNYISAIYLLKNSQFQTYFLDENIPQSIIEKEFLIFTGDPADNLLKDLIQNKHFENFDYYKNLVKIINSKKSSFSLSDILFLLHFCAVFSKEELFKLMSKIEFLYHYNNLKEAGEDDLLVLMLLIENSHIDDKQRDLKSLVKRFDKLSFDSKFIILYLLHKYKN